VLVFGLTRAGRAGVAPFAVGAYIAAAYWFTSSTSFANPAVTIARTLSDTFAGIAPSSVPGFVAAQRAGFPAPGSVGAPADGVELRLGEDGEILVKSAGAFIGYWRDEAATREVVADGWVATGDVGRFPPGGELQIVDRKRDILITEGGKNIAPQLIEDRLRASPFVAEAVVFGDGRKYLSALFEIDEETVSQWARARNLAHGGYSDLVASPEVASLVSELVEAVNRELSRPEQIKSFRLLPRSLDPEVEGEPVTPTRKVKRKQMYEHFRQLVESMYA
jgi:long-chain acyl-CoA synthetase